MSGIDVSRVELVEALKFVGGVVERRNTIPIAAHVLVECDGSRLSLRATDFEMQALASVEAAGGKDAFTADAAKLLAAVGSLAAERVALAVADGRLVVTGGRARRTLATLPAPDFPKFEAAGEGARRIEMPASRLARTLASVRWAVSTEATRYYLNGICLRSADGGLDAVATDGHRLARLRVAEIDGVEELDVIVPTKAVDQLLRLLDASDAAVALTIDSDKIDLAVGERRLVARLIEGRFPDYVRVIPVGNADLLTVTAGEMGRAAGAVAAVIDAEGDKIKFKGLRLTLGEAVEIEGGDRGSAQAMEPVDAQFAGEAGAVGLNAQYLRDMMRAFDSEAVVEMAFAGPKAPVLVTSAAAPDLTAVLMPMNVA